MLGARHLRIAGQYAIGLLGRLADKLRVDIGEIDDAELGDAMLARPEEFAGAPDGDVAFRQLEAVDRSTVLHFHHGREPLRIRRLAHEDAVRALRSSPDPSAKLMQLGETESFSTEDDHHRRVWYVYAHLDHRGGDEDVDLARGEAAHDRIAFFRRHAA